MPERCVTMLKSKAIRSLCGTGSPKSTDSPVCKQIAGIWNGAGLVRDQFGYPIGGNQCW